MPSPRNKSSGSTQNKNNVELDQLSLQPFHNNEAIALEIKNFKMMSDDPELKSFIYQMINELSLYVTATTIVTVIAKDPKKLSAKMRQRYEHISNKDLPQMTRIAITLSDQGAKISEEVLADNIYDALRVAKENLLHQLGDLHNSVMSKQERIVQLEQMKQTTWLH